MSNLVLFDDDLVENPTPRVPVALCLDTSGSMSGEPITELANGVAQFYASVYDHEIARYSAEIAVVTFGGRVETVADFGPVERTPNLSIRASGQTPMGGAVLTALDLLEQRKQQYQEAGVDYYQPWLVLMTDGAPTDAHDFNRAVQRTQNLVNKKKLSLFPIGIGAQADLATLGQFSPGRSPLRLRGLAFEQFFEWLSASIERVSASTPGEAVPLDVEGIKGWGEV